MLRNMTILAGSLLLVAAACSSSRNAERPRMVTCDSRNNAYTECERVGNAQVVLARQFSDSACVEGMSWGVRNGRLWTDRGCRAEFSVGGAGFDRTIDSRVVTGGTTLVCESQDGRLRRCPANTFGGVRLVRQISSADCVFDRTWGWDTGGVWVNEGCRAEFAVGSTATAGRAGIVCESQGGRRNHCPADTRFGVELVRQLSDAACIRNRTWGEDAQGIWVTEGCRAEFALRTR